MKYGGFYISEAELGYDKNGHTTNIYRQMINLKGNGDVDYVGNGDYFRTAQERHLTGKAGEIQSTFKLTYDSAIAESQKLYADSASVVSHLTYGLEYDAAVNWLIKTNAIKISEAFNDSTDKGKHQGNNNLGQELKLNGIYGLAGNLSEITQEKAQNGDLILRGGSWATGGKFEQLASKVTYSKDEIEKNEIIPGTSDTRGETIGIRVCLYIKPENYTSMGTELNQAKQKAKEDLEKYIDSKYVKVDGIERNLFDNNKLNGIYVSVALKEIVNEINNKIEKETSSAGLNKIVQYGKDEVDKIESHIKIIADWPKNDKEYTLRSNIIEECNKIKDEAAWDINKMRWDNTNTKIAQIRDEAIEKMRFIVGKNKGEGYLGTIDIIKGQKSNSYPGWHIEIKQADGSYAKPKAGETIPCYIKDNVLYGSSSVQGDARLYNEERTEYYDVMVRKTQYELDKAAGYKIYKTSNEMDKYESILGTGEEILEEYTGVINAQIAYGAKDSERGEFVLVVLDHCKYSIGYNKNKNNYYFRIDSLEETTKYRVYFKNGSYITSTCKLAQSEWQFQAIKAYEQVIDNKEFEGSVLSENVKNNRTCYDARNEDYLVIATQTEEYGDLIATKSNRYTLVMKNLSRTTMNITNIGEGYYNGPLRLPKASEIDEIKQLMWNSGKDVIKWDKDKYEWVLDVTDKNGLINYTPRELALYKHSDKKHEKGEEVKSKKTDHYYRFVIDL